MPWLKKYGGEYQRYLNQAFTGFPREVDFNNGLSLLPSPTLSKASIGANTSLLTSIKLTAPSTGWY